MPELDQSYKDFIKKTNDEIQNTPHGQISIVVLLRGGLPIMTSYRTTVMKRKRYKIPKLA